MFVVQIKYLFELRLIFSQFGNYRATPTTSPLGRSQALSPSRSRGAPLYPGFGRWQADYGYGEDAVRKIVGKLNLRRKFKGFARPARAAIPPEPPALRAGCGGRTEGRCRCGRSGWICRSFFDTAFQPNFFAGI